MYNKSITLGSGLNSGYRYFLDIDHPLAYKPTGLVLLHRHVASITLGRWLSSSEHVHHIDGNRLNNSADNLLVLSPSEHSKLHSEQEKVSLHCAHCESLFQVVLSKQEQKYCSDSCRSSAQVRNKGLTKELLDSLIPHNSWVNLGAMFGYSDNGIKKRARALGCDISRARYKAKR